MNEIVVASEAAAAEEPGEVSLDNAMRTLRAQKAENDAQEEKVQDSDKSATDERKPGTKYVKTDDPEVLARIKELHRQVSGSDEKNKILIAEWKRLAEANAKLAAKVAEREAKEAEKEVKNVIDTLRAKIREARDVGDDDKLDALNEELQDILIERKTAKLVAPKAVEPAQEPQPTLSDIPPEERAAADRYVFEIDEDGDFVRPYLHADSPDFDKAVKKASDISKSLIANGKQPTIEAIMPILDRAMGKKDEPQNDEPAKKSAHAEVLSGSGNLTGARKPKTMNLTTEQKYVARRMGISEADYAASLAAEAKAG